MVHFPIALLTTAYLTEAVVHTQAYMPSLITSYLPSATELSRLSYYALSLGLLTAVPTITSGVAQALPVLSRGITQADGSVHPKTKTIIAHAVASDLAIAASAYIWWTKRSESAAKLLLKGEFPGAYETTSGAVAVGLLVTGILLFAAKLGGDLVYDYGMGMSVGKKGKTSQKKTS